MKPPLENTGATSAAPRTSGWMEWRGREGFFRVGRAATGRWWLVDPHGRPFFYRGVCAINRAGRPGGRRAQPGPYAAAVDAKYGSRERFVEATLERLRRWNFNALGAWTTEEFFERGMPYTEILEFAKVGPLIHGTGVRVPDVFDPAWEEAIDQTARQLCAPRRDSRQLVGYFTDNELGWAQPRTDEIHGAQASANRWGGTLWEICRALPATWAAARAAREFPDNDSFSREFARRYVRLTAEAIRRYDPNHLILGARFGAPPGAAILAAFRPPGVDVVSANNYRRAMRERMDEYYRAEQMPVLNGEFAWASPPFLDRAFHTEAERRQPLPEVVRAAGRRTLEEAATHPGLVGYTWYRWVQNPEPCGIGYGLVDECDNEVTFNVALLTEVNAALEEAARRTGGSGRDNARPVG